MFYLLQYLGDDLEDVRGRTIHEDDSIVTLPLLCLPGVMLCPGQTIPLQLFQPHIVAMMQRVRDDDKTFGLLTSRCCNRLSSLFNQGHSLQIYTTIAYENNYHSFSPMLIQAIRIGY